MSLATALTTAPAARGNYRFVGETTEVNGGGQVGQSVNTPKTGTPDEFLTHQNGNVQQSMTLRAVSAAIGGDVLPFTDIADVLRQVGRITAAQSDELCAIVYGESFKPVKAAAKTEEDASQPA